MSASKEKKNRLAQRDEGLSKKAAAAAEQAKKDRTFRRNAIIAVVVIVLIVAAALVINSNLFYTRTTAVQIGDTRYSPAEVNYFFKASFNRIYEEYYGYFGSSISSIVDSSKPLNTQPFSEDQTWADVVFERTKADMIQFTAYYDAAVKAGYTLNEEDQASVSSNLMQMQLYASSNGFSSVDGFLAAYYGKGMNEKLYTQLSEKMALAARYAQDLQDSLVYSDAELEEYYQAHVDEMDYYNYYLYMVGTSNEKFSDLDDEAKNTAAHDAAEEIVKADTADTFVENVRAFTGTDTNVRVTHTVGSSLGSSYKDWIMAPERKAGDTTVVDMETGSYAIMYLGYDNNDYNTVSMRHILITAEADENGEYTDEAKAAAEARIRELLTEWENGEKTEDSFAALADEYTDDTASKGEGGLYEDIYKNQMVPGIDSFLFTADRKSGDTEIIFNDGDYVGCHLVYFVGEGETNHRLELAKDAKTEEDFNAKYEELSAGYEAVERGGLRFANLA